VHPSPVLLFRWSALTMNSHRIHYDRPYVTGVEGYPGLLVQGSFTQMLLLDLFRRELPRATLRTFDVRAVSSLYDDGDFFVEGAPGADGRSASLWTRSHRSALAMTANATFDP
jgi:3-methylfumaryl-CoA hydratase